MTTPLRLTEDGDLGDIVRANLNALETRYNEFRGTLLAQIPLRTSGSANVWNKWGVRTGGNVWNQLPATVNVDACWDDISKVFTPPSSGTYMFHVNVQIGAGWLQSDYFGLMVEIGGVPYKIHMPPSTPTGKEILDITFFLDLISPTTVEFGSMTYGSFMSSISSSDPWTHRGAPSGQPISIWKV